MYICAYAANKWGQQYLTREFFHQLGERMPERVLLAVAEQDGELVAGASAGRRGFLVR